MRRKERERIMLMAEEVAEKSARNLTRWRSTVYRSRKTGSLTIVDNDPTGRKALKATGSAIVMRD